MTMFALMGSGSQARALLGAVILAAVAGGVSAVGAVATAAIVESHNAARSDTAPAEVRNAGT